MMNAHPEAMGRIECTVDGDDRLIAGASMIVAHVARRAGITPKTASDLADSTVNACAALLRSTEANGFHTIRLSACELANRIEVSVEPLPASGTPPSSERSGNLADRIRQALKSVADSVSVDLHEGLPRVTLVKNCGVGKHPFSV